MTRTAGAVTIGQTPRADLLEPLLAPPPAARAGGFPGVRARGVLVRPFDAAVAELRALAAVRIAVVVPIEAQVSPSERKWRAAGFDPVVIVGSPPALDAVT